MPSPRPVTRVGLVRRHAQPGVPIYDRKLSADEVLARIERYHAPYHRVLDDACELVDLVRGEELRLVDDEIVRTAAGGEVFDEVGVEVQLLPRLEGVGDETEA